MSEITAVLLVITVALSAVVFAQQQVIRQQRDALQRVYGRERDHLNRRDQQRWAASCERWRKLVKELEGEQS